MAAVTGSRPPGKDHEPWTSAACPSATGDEPVMSERSRARDPAPSRPGAAPSPLLPSRVARRREGSTTKPSWRKRGSSGPRGPWPATEGGESSMPANGELRVPLDTGTWYTRWRAAGYPRPRPSGTGCWRGPLPTNEAAAAAATPQAPTISVREIAVAPAAALHMGEACCHSSSTSIRCAGRSPPRCTRGRSRACRRCAGGPERRKGAGGEGRRTEVPSTRPL
jgi:hypothetical protein